MSKSNKQNLTERLQTLSLSTNTLAKSSKSPKQLVADSWDDGEDASSSSGTETETEATHVASPRSPIVLMDYPSAPPPTPVSRPVTSSSSQGSTFHNVAAYTSGANATATTGKTSGAGVADVRPEKSTAAATRMIAGALGVKAPKRTEEQRKYDKAAKENEVKRRQKEKEEAEQARKNREAAVRAVWEG